jgi:hypothetical protein
MKRQLLSLFQNVCENLVTSEKTHLAECGQNPLIDIEKCYLHIACSLDICLYWAVKMLIFFGSLGRNNKLAQK